MISTSYLAAIRGYKLQTHRKTRETDQEVGFNKHTYCYLLNEVKGGEGWKKNLVRLHLLIIYTFTISAKRNCI